MGAGADVNAFFAITTMIIAVPTGVKSSTGCSPCTAAASANAMSTLWSPGFPCYLRHRRMTGAPLSVPPATSCFTTVCFSVYFHNVIIGGVLLCVRRLHLWFPRLWLPPPGGAWEGWVLVLVPRFLSGLHAPHASGPWALRGACSITRFPSGIPGCSWRPPRPPSSSQESGSPEIAQIVASFAIAEKWRDTTAIPGTGARWSGRRPRRRPPSTLRAAPESKRATPIGRRSSARSSSTCSRTSRPDVVQIADDAEQRTVKRWT